MRGGGGGLGGWSRGERAPVLKISRGKGRRIGVSIVEKMGRGNNEENAKGMIE